MRKYIYLSILGGWLFLTASCSDFLKPDSPTEYTPTEASSLEEMLLSEAYLGNRSGDVGYWGFIHYLDDDLTARPYIGITNQTTNMSEYEEDRVQAAKVLYSWTENYDIVLAEGSIGGSENINMYKQAYNLIVGANAALDYVDKMKGTENEKRNVKAQAYALRAFHYFHLTNLYGSPYHSHPNGLGVPLKLTSKIEEGRLTRKTVKECYDQVVKDFLAAEENYSAMGEGHRYKRNFRTSLAMVRLMLSRVYLYMENWQEAARYARLVMDDSSFSLYNLNEIERPKNGYYDFISYAITSSEKAETAGDNPEVIWLYGSVQDGVNIVSLQTNESANNKKKIALFNASDELLDSYQEKLSDMEEDGRVNHYIIDEYDVDGKTVKRAYGKIRISNNSSGHWPVSTALDPFGRALRLSEAYLNYAEATAILAKDGKATPEEAIAALNKLRSNRIKNYNPLGAQDFSDAMDLVHFTRNERRRELCFEGHRWFDLRRYGMPEIAHAWFNDANQEIPQMITLPINAHFYAIPLPQSILDSNSALDPNTWQ